MNRPESVNILGQVFRIKYVKRLKGGLGETRNDKRVILIKECSEAEMEATLFHEIIHAVLFISGLSFVIDPDQEGAEEAVVRALEHGLMPLIKLEIPPT